MPPGHTSSNPILRTVAVYLVLCLLCLICARWPHVLLDEVGDPILPIIKLNVPIWMPLHVLNYDYVTYLGMVRRARSDGPESHTSKRRTPILCGNWMPRRVQSSCLQPRMMPTFRARPTLTGACGLLDERSHSEAGCAFLGARA